MQFNRLSAALAVALLAGPATAQDRYLCHAWNVCTPDAGCREGDLIFDLVYVDPQTIQIGMADTRFVVALDTDTDTIAWRDRTTVYQMFLMGDGGAILTRIPDRGGWFERVETMQASCGPP